MKTQFDIKDLLSKGKIESELELERAQVADRKLRLLAKESPKHKKQRKALRALIEAYENQHWSGETVISEQQIKESDLAEQIAEKERLFIASRKSLIRQKLKNLDLNQQQFGVLLGHRNKSYISELINGISPFSLKDIIIIHRLLNIELADLIPTIISQKEQVKIKSAISELNNAKLKLNQEDLELA